jgi:GNAT superfamily N-acetyltransferase
MAQTGIGLNQGVGLTRATSGDTELLTESATRTFTGKGRREGGHWPRAHHSPAWHRHMIANGYFYKITLDSEVVGGLIMVRLACDHFHLVRVWVDPAHQGRGVGARALALLEASRRQVTLWTVGVPAWARRCRRFFEANGYRAAGEAEGTVRYERHRPGVLRHPPSLP